MRFFCEGKLVLIDIDFKIVLYFFFGVVKVIFDLGDDNLGIFFFSYYIYVNLKNCVCYICSSKLKVNIEVCLYKLREVIKSFFCR